MNKKKLYETIMTDVSKIVKSHLYEASDNNSKLDEINQKIKFVRTKIQSLNAEIDSLKIQYHDLIDQRKWLGKDKDLYIDKDILLNAYKKFIKNYPELSKYKALFTVKKDETEYLICFIIVNDNPDEIIKSLLYKFQVYLNNLSIELDKNIKAVSQTMYEHRYKLTQKNPNSEIQYIPCN